MMIRSVRVEVTVESPNNPPYTLLFISYTLLIITFNPIRPSVLITGLTKDLQRIHAKDTHVEGYEDRKNGYVTQCTNAVEFIINR